MTNYNRARENGAGARARAMSQIQNNTSAPYGHTKRIPLFLRNSFLWAYPIVGVRNYNGLYATRNKTFITEQEQLTGRTLMFSY